MGGLFLRRSKRKLVFQLRTGKGKGMAYQNVVYRIVFFLTSDYTICPLVVHKTRDDWGKVLVAVE